MAVQEILTDAEHRMKSAVEAMTHDFSTYRTGRASPAVLDRIMVEYYGNETPLSQVANISIPEPRQLYVQPWDKSMIPAIERAILKGDVGLSPVNDGSGLRLNFPQMNEERRKELVKQVNARSEQACVAIRNVRRDAIEHVKALEKKKEITEDEVKHEETRIQKITDKFIADVHDHQKKKDAELMEV